MSKVGRRESLVTTDEDDEDDGPLRCRYNDGKPGHRPCLKWIDGIKVEFVGNILLVNSISVRCPENHHGHRYVTPDKLGLSVRDVLQQVASSATEPCYDDRDGNWVLGKKTLPKAVSR